MDCSVDGYGVQYRPLRLGKYGRYRMSGSINGYRWIDEWLGKWWWSLVVKYMCTCLCVVCMYRSIEEVNDHQLLAYWNKQSKQILRFRRQFKINFCLPNSTFQFCQSPTLIKKKNEGKKLENLNYRSETETTLFSSSRKR